MTLQENIACTCHRRGVVHCLCTFKAQMTYSGCLTTYENNHEESLSNNVAVLKVCNFIKKSPTQVFSCEYFELFKFSFLYRALLVASPVSSCYE